MAVAEQKRDACAVTVMPAKNNHFVTSEFNHPCADLLPILGEKGFDHGGRHFLDHGRGSAKSPILQREGGRRFKVGRNPVPRSALKNILGSAMADLATARKFARECGALPQAQF